MAVPYIFSTVPGGSSIPLSELDANFAYLSTNPSISGNLSITGNLGVTGTSAFTGPVTMNGGLVLSGPFTINGHSVSPTGTTGVGDLVFNAGPTLVAPILGTPASGNLSLCTGYPASQVTGLAPGVLPFLANPTTANLAAAVVDETGTGNLVLSNNPSLTSPNLTTPILGVPQSGNLVNCTGYNGANLSGVVPVARGGTGMTTTGAVGDVVVVAAPGVLGYVSAPPASGLAGGLASQIVYQSAPNTTSFIPNGTTGQVLLSNGAATPSWGNVNASTNVTGILPVSNGGTGLSALGTGVVAAMANPVDAAGGLITYSSAVTPAGAIMFFAMASAPTGWLFCNGSAVSRTTYAALFAAIGTLYGPGDGSTTFNLPDLDGQFIRGWDSSGSVDPGRTFGSTQSDAYLNHTHSITDPGHNHTYSYPNSAYPLGSSSARSFWSTESSATYNTGSAATGITVDTSTTGATETRPKNVALYACIKY